MIARAFERERAVSGASRALKGFEDCGVEVMKNSLNLIEISESEIKVTGFIFSNFIFSNREDRFILSVTHHSPRLI
jgi:hypothetical protein